MSLLKNWDILEINANFLAKQANLATQPCRTIAGTE